MSSIAQNNTSSVRVSTPIAFTVPDRPVPAVRMTSRGKWVKASAKRYLAYKDSVGWAAKAAYFGLLTGSLAIEVHFYLNGGKTPDTDNLVKGIQDGCNGVIWRDDTQVVEVHAYRHQGVPERAEVQVWELAEKEELDMG